MVPIPGNVTQKRHAEVAVIGAGPAGCAAACTLGREGFDVAVFERGRPRKDKACGDAVVPSAAEFLSRYGITQDYIASLGGHPFDRIDIYNDGLLIWQAGLGGKTGWVIRRAVLDQELRDVCSQYSAIHYETLVTDVIAEPHGILELCLRRLDGSQDVFSCNAVILANGSGSLLSRKWGISGYPIMAASIRSYAPVEKKPQAPVFQFAEARRPGYGWVFPLAGEEVNIGVCTLSPNDVKHLRRLAAEYSAEWGVRQHCRWRGGVGALWSGKGHTWHQQAGILSCGDAAGLIDPISGQGITAALLSGGRAGLAVSSYLRGNEDQDRLIEYSRWLRQHFSRVYGKTKQRQIWSTLCGI